jgi:hypothetical protein
MHGKQLQTCRPQFVYSWSRDVPTISTVSDLYAAEKQSIHPYICAGLKIFIVLQESFALSRWKSFGGRHFLYSNKPNSIPDRCTDFRLRHSVRHAEVHPASYPMGVRGSYRRANAAGHAADHSLHLLPRLKMRGVNLHFPIPLHGVVLKPKDRFTFTFTSKESCLKPSYSEDYSTPHPLTSPR